VDADSCARDARLILERAARRIGAETYFVANKPIPLALGPGGPVSMRVVSNADEAIVEGIGPGELCVTRDIPLAVRVLDRGAACVNDRGDEFDASNIRERLSLRDASLSLRLAGLESAGGNGYGEKEKKRFADCLDRVLRRLAKG